MTQRIQLIGVISSPIERMGEASALTLHVSDDHCAHAYRIMIRAALLEEFVSGSIVSVEGGLRWLTDDSGDSRLYVMAEKYQLLDQTHYLQVMNQLDSGATCLA